MSENSKWNYNEFITFLLIYASNVDLDFSKDEINQIKEKSGHKTFEKMNRLFGEMNDFEALQTILDYKGLHYPTIDRKNELLNKLKLQFFADGDFSVMERELLSFLDKLM